MTKHNAALYHYIQSWQNFMASLPLGARASAWHQDAPAADFTDDPAALMRATAMSWEDLDRALSQYEIWQNLPRHRSEGGIIWQENTTTLMDYGGAPEAPPVLMVPSMINGHEVFDLPSPGSLVEFLKDAGFHPLVLAWGETRADDASMTVEHHQNRLQNAARFLFETKGRYGVVAYCLGGTLSAMTELEGAQAQILLGAPWRFSHEQGRIGGFSDYLQAESVESLSKQIAQLRFSYGCFPAQVVDYFFSWLNPLQFVQKFRNRAERAELPLFDALEDWLALSGRNLPAPLAEEVLIDWYRNDELYETQAQIPRPTLAVYGAKDHIAPPHACAPLKNDKNNVQLLKLLSGHVGIIVGNQARRDVWPQMATFFNDHLK